MAKSKTWIEIPYDANRKGMPTREFGELSGRHDGQIVSPCVSFRVTGSGRGQKYTADYYWVDGSISRGEKGREYGHGAVSGDFWAVVHGLRAVGIFLA